jgi:hypothetical protein
LKCDVSELGLLGTTNVVAQEEVVKKVILFFLSMFLVIGPALSASGQTISETPDDCGVEQQEPPPAGAIIADLIIVRPLGVIFTAFGVVATVVSLPIAVPSRSVGTVAQKLVADPFAFTFARPLGVLSPEVEVPWN